jgi:hypothetical protein
VLAWELHPYCHTLRVVHPFAVASQVNGEIVPAAVASIWDNAISSVSSPMLWHSRHPAKCRGARSRQCYLTGG